MPNFEVFRKQSVPVTDRPMVTIQKRGILFMNQSAFHELGQPGTVELLYDPDERIIGVRPVNARKATAYTVRKPAKTNSVAISLTAFSRHYNLDTSQARRYVPTYEGGVMMIDLKDDGEKVTSNRNGKGKGTVLQLPEPRGLEDHAQQV